MSVASVGSAVSMPQQLTHINQDSFFVKVWGVVEKDKLDFVRDIIEVYTPKLAEGYGQLRSLSELIPGNVVLVLYNNLFQRAEVLQMDGDHTKKVMVNFIDLGIVTSVDVSDIRISDAFLNGVPRIALAEDFILYGVVAKKQWTSEEVDSVNSCLRHCTELCLSGIVADKKIIQVMMTMNAQAKINLSNFLIEGGLADQISDDNFTNLLRSKYGNMSVPVTNPFTVSPPEPLQSFHSVAAVQSYVYFTLPVDSTHDVVVSHVIDGMNVFTVQLKKSIDVDLPKLMARIDDIRPIPITEEIGPGTLCLGRFIQCKSLCRAVVCSVLAEGASLYFVDFGNTEIVPFNEIYKIPPEFVPEPTMALRFALADLWSALSTAEASAIFTKIVLQRNLAFKLKVIKPLVPTQQRCELFIIANDKTINIKTKILDKVKLMKPAVYKKLTFKKNQVADVIVTFSESPLRFFVQLELNQSILEVLMKCVEDYCTNSENKGISFAEDIVENMAVCAPYEEDKYYRGLIMKEPDNEDNITVFYVDYGNHDTVHYSKLRIMNNEMMSQFPMQAIECRLDIDSNLITNTEVNVRFIELVDGENFKMSVKNILPGNILLVDLVDQHDLNIASHLTETFGAKSTSASYSASPKLPLQQSSSINWKVKKSSSRKGDFSKSRNEKSRHDDRNDKSRSDSNFNHCRPNEDRERGRNSDSRRRRSDGFSERRSNDHSRAGRSKTTDDDEFGSRSPSDDQRRNRLNDVQKKPYSRVSSSRASS